MGSMSLIYTRFCKMYGMFGGFITVSLCQPEWTQSLVTVLHWNCCASAQLSLDKLLPLYKTFTCGWEEEFWPSVICFNCKDQRLIESQYIQKRTDPIEYDAIWETKRNLIWTDLAMHTFRSLMRRTTDPVLWQQSKILWNNSAAKMSRNSDNQQNQTFNLTIRL